LLSSRTRTLSSRTLSTFGASASKSFAYQNSSNFERQKTTFFFLNIGDIQQVKTLACQKTFGFLKAKGFDIKDF
jgi:hypothetical protein